MLKKLHLIIALVLIAYCSKAQTNYPYTFGYVGGQQVEHAGTGVADTFSISFGGGNPFGSKWVSGGDISEDVTITNSYVLSGFRYNLLYIKNGFEKDLFASKGYYGDFVQLRWDLERYANQVTGFRVYRKELGSQDDSTQVANLPPDARDWQDEFSESNVLYKYTLVAKGISSFVNQKFLNYVESVGFRVPYGRISGRVTYEGGASVQGVNVIAETDDDFAGSSVELNGTDAYLGISPPVDAPFFKLDTAFTFQGWFRPNAASGTRTLFEKQNQYKLEHANGLLTFTAGTSGSTQNITLNFTQKVDTFFHVAAMRTADSLKLIVLYDTETTYISKTKLTATTTANNNDFLIGKGVAGNYFKGYIDEVRIWHKSFEEEDIIVQSSLYIPGTDNNLSAYYRFNEGQSNVFYDLSRKGFNFNEFHGFMSSSVTWSSTIPNSNQLAIKGITDSNGNYIISGIPYATDGSTYRFVPVFGVHSFDPTEKLLFIGPGADAHSGINFIDVASFPVVGEVFYKDTNFPVQGVRIKIDGQTAIDSEGQPIVTDNIGKFQIDVPIGQHYIQLDLYGHGFENNGRFPVTEGTFFDFQQPYTFQTRFRDTTLVKVIGKVVGGPVQAAKPKGLGKTTNNLGQAKIILGTQKGYDLTDKTAGVDSTLNNEMYVGITLTDKGDTKVKILKTSPKQIEISPDPVTGEYVAYLLPEKYTVKSITAGSYTYPDDFLTTLDLTNTFSSRTEADSVVVGTVVSPTGEVVQEYQLDSIQFDKNLDFIYRTDPLLTVTASDDSPVFWERNVNAKDGVSVDVTDDAGNPLTAWPIFSQRNHYDLKIKVFENYDNGTPADDTDDDKVPVTDGIVGIQNAMAINNAMTNYEIDNFGIINYSFTAGLPNIIGDSTKSMSIIAYTGRGGSIQTKWNHNQPNNTADFKGYVFGGLPTGNNFVTAGPNQVDMILRDPYGSSSYAYFEVGGSVSKTSSYSVSNAESGTEVGSVFFGTKVTTSFGTPFAQIETTVEVKGELSIGLEHSETWLTNNSSTSTTTTTKRWQTSSGLDFVGSLGDVFIGHSTNIVYGISKNLMLIPDAVCGGCIDFAGPYDIGIFSALRMNPEFGTAFQYSQNHIKYYLIPNLELLRNTYLQNNSGVGQMYTSHQAIGTANYGSPNSTEISSTVINATDTTLAFTGDNYSMSVIIGGSCSNCFAGMSGAFVDTVDYYNKQINSWEKLLARNEKEKLEASLLENISFDAGAIYSSSISYDSTETKTKTFEFTVAPTVAGEIGKTINGTGAKMVLSEKYTHNETDVNGDVTTNTVTFGYELSDPDEGDYLSIDVKQPNSHTGPVFAVRGGQSKCPFNDEEVTEYYQVGTLLSAATMAREVPQIQCDAPVQINVPEDEMAVYTVQMGNNSEAASPSWYMVSVADQTNQNGAIIKMDGTPIGNGRVIYIPAASVINKAITIQKLNTAAVNDYDNIAIVLRSVCQSDPSDNLADIADTIRLTAKFKPVCSRVEVSSPSDLWVRNVNTGSDLNVVINDYMLSHPGFEKVLFQYKSTSSSAWITDMAYFVNKADYDIAIAAGATAQWIDTQSSLNYAWDMSSVQDRNYDIRALSVCADGTENSSSILTGIKDSKRPKIFGTPQPGDGILSPGDDIMLTFDETIEAGLLLGTNFSVRGVLNGAEIRHNSALYFDGIDDYASVIAGANLQNKSFTIEFWTKRSDTNAGVIFQQADIELGFDAANTLYAKLGSQTRTTVETYNFTDKWIHIALSYNYDTKLVDVYSAYDGHNAIELEDISFPATFTGTGRMLVGKDQAGANPYNGYIHDFRVWEKVVGYGSVNSNMLITQSGNEIGLAGLWPMDEAHGEYAQDLSRSHNALLVGAAWRVFPTGNARTFDGTSSRIDIPTASSVVITNEMDFTLEFWFKAPSQSNSVLFSNGKADGSEPAGAFEDIWIVGIDGSQQLYVANNGSTITLEGENYLDNQWHHLAVVMDRNANTSLYVDGNLKTYEHSSNYGGLKGANMTIGASRHYTNGTPYSNYYNGSIDEFRIWKLVRTSKLLNMDMNAKLKGDEKGLVAYYPFDKYDINLILQPSLVDCDYDDDTEALTGLTATATGGAYENTNVPNLKDARPVQNLAYNWVVNDDKIIINLDEPAELIEKCIIEFTVDKVEDLRENRMASPVTWTAYINKNTVIWDQSVINLEKVLYDELTFTVDVLNIGGVEQNFTISNLPNWISASTTSGTLTPDSKQTISFAVDASTNIGNYELSLFLGANLGYEEKLAVNLKVYEPGPVWEVDPGDYQYSMSIIGQVKIDGILSTNTDDMVGVFVGNECRGVARVEYIEAYDMFEVFLNIYSNVQSGENLEFKIWNAGQGMQHTNVSPDSMPFVYNTMVGTTSSPQLLETSNSYVRDIELAKGWKWISFNLENTALSDINLLFKDLAASSGDMVKGQTAYSDYDSSIGWNGSIKTGGGLKLEQMYMVKLAQADTIQYSGAMPNPLLKPLSLVTGWNWIGFVPQFNMSVADAFSNYAPANGDMIKSQYAFAMYDVAMGWIGSLDYMVPGQGYMFKTSNASGSLIYPEKGLSQGGRLASQDNGTFAVPGDWQIDREAYRFNTSIVASLDMERKVVTEKHIIGAFIDGTCRGVGKAVSIGGEWRFFITVYTDDPEQEVQFKVIDGNDILEANESIAISPNTVLGDVNTPVKLTVKDMRSAFEAVISAFPNPFNGQVTVSYRLKSTSNVQLEVFNMLGMRVTSVALKSKLAGNHHWIWDGLDQTKKAVVPGVYTIKLVTNDKVMSISVVKN